MPIITSDYKVRDFFLAGDLQTILPALFRKVGNVVYTRKRIYTPDDDFLDLDWSRTGSDHLVILCHGLEGSTKTQYMLGMVKALNNAGLDTLAWHYRSCSEEINKLHRFYHSGETGDLGFLIDLVLQQEKYKTIYLAGFSIGGNITLKYLGEQGKNINPLIKKAVVFSVPTHLASGAAQLATWRSKIYMSRFLKSLRKKFEAKARLFPELINLEGIEKIRTFHEFDERYTAPIHGFKSAKDYWKKNSSIYFIKDISIPTLIVSAKNDPFLANECYPVKEAENNNYVFLEMPAAGGHCGFYEKNPDGLYWSEKRAIEFFKAL